MASITIFNLVFLLNFGEREEKMYEIVDQTAVEDNDDDTSEGFCFEFISNFISEINPKLLT